MRVAGPGDVIIDHFPVFDDDGFTKLTGLDPLTDFSFEVFHDGEEDSLTVDLEEIGATGEYKIEYQPMDSGIWVIQVLVEATKEILSSRVEISEAALELIKLQCDKIDLASTRGLSTVQSGSLLDRVCNKDAQKTYNQATDSLEANRDRMG